MIKQKTNKIQISNAIDEKGNIITDLTDIKRNIKNSMDNFTPILSIT